MGIDPENWRNTPRKIEAAFNDLAPRYDFLNHLFSFGQDIFWRFETVRRLHPSVEGPLLDAATGTGDMALSLAKKYPDRKVVGVDLSEGMLCEGRIKARRKGLFDRVVLEAGNVTDLKYESDTFAASTIGFGIRNVDSRPKALSELYRVLAPGGRLLVLEFAMPDFPVFSTVYKFYFGYIMPAIAALFGQGDVFRYLFQSVRQFVPVDEFCALLKNTGFEKVKTTSFSLGSVILYCAEKPE